MSSRAVVYPKTGVDIPQSIHTAAYRLFHYPRACSIQQMFTMDPERAKKWGTLTSGNSKFDLEVNSSWVEVLVTPVEMCDLIKRGASIEFYNYEVAKATYLDLVEHLRTWLHDVSNDPTLMEAPIDDLREFDILAGMIWPYARFLLAKDDESTGYGQYMASIARSRASLALSARYRLSQQDPMARVPKAYKPLSESIAEWIYTRNQQFLSQQ